MQSAPPMAADSTLFRHSLPRQWRFPAWHRDCVRSCVASRKRRAILGALVVIPTTLPVGGCAVLPSNQVEKWAASNGGTISGGRQERCERAIARLQVPKQVACLKVAVLNSETTGAFCWRSGALFVTRGLVDIVDDDELAAAIAHEVGHLLVDGGPAPAAALDGYRLQSNDAEAAADLAGRELLRRSEVPEEALPGLLNKLAVHPPTDSARRESLARRAARLTFAGGPTPRP